MSPRRQGSELADEELVRLLADVEREEPYYCESLSPESSKYQKLCELEARGYIRYCVYPEEFWIILPRGREFLSSQRLFWRELRSNDNHEPSN